MKCFVLSLYLILAVCSVGIASPVRNPQPAISSASDPADSAWDNPFGTGIAGTVHAIAVAGEDVYVGGFFSTAGGVPARNVAKWDGSSWSALGAGLSDTVLALAVIDGDLYAGGQFDSAGGIAANYIAKWDGSTWTSLGAGTNWTVYAIAAFDSKIFVGGRFTVAGAANADGLASWNGSAWTGYAVGGVVLDQYVSDLAASATELYLAGWFLIDDFFGPFYLSGAMRWNGGSLLVVGQQFNGFVTRVGVAGTDVYAAGDFTANNFFGPMNRVAKWNGSSWTALGSGIEGGYVGTISTSGSELYAGGRFTTAGGDTISNIARWNGSEWSSLGSGAVASPSQSVNAIAPQGTDLYVGGNFDTAGAKPMPKIARWNIAAAPEWSWARSAGGANSERITGVASDDTGNVYVTGLFDGSIDFGGGPIASAGSRDFFLAKYDADGNLVWAQTGGGTDLDNAVGVALDSAGNAYVTGNFLSAAMTIDTVALLAPSAGSGDVFIAKFDPNGRALWARAAGGTGTDVVLDVAVDDAGNVLVCGQFLSPSIQFGATPILVNLDASWGDAFVARYSPLGAALWSDNQGSTGEGIIFNAVATGLAGDLWFAGTQGPGAVITWYDTSGSAGIVSVGLGVGEGIVVDDDGNVFFTGTFTSPSIVLGADTLINAGGVGGTSDVFLLKADSIMTIQWARRAGGPGTDFPVDIAAGDSGAVYLTGGFMSSTLDLGPYTLANSSSSQDLFLVKYDAAGSAPWIRAIGSNLADISYAVDTDPAGNVLLGGTFSSPSVRFGTHQLTNTGVGTFDYFIAKLGNTPIHVPVSRTATIRPGWNLVSLPVAPTNDSVQALFPLATSSAFAYTETGYDVRATCEPGSGYWLKFPSAGEADIDGYAVVGLSVPVFEGWNLVGSISAAIAANAVTSDPPGMITGNFFGYEGSYVTADTISPGNAYWVKVAQAGELHLSAASVNAPGAIRIVPTGELPPAPPVDAAADSPGGPGRGQSPVPQRFALEQNYPNPFNPSTVIRYALPVRTHVSLRVFNVLGQEVAALVEGEQEAGFRSVVWDASAVPAGVYFYRLHAARYDATKKVLLVR
jgi:hypothetical protein